MISSIIIWEGGNNPKRARTVVASRMEVLGVVPWQGTTAYGGNSLLDLAVGVTVDMSAEQTPCGMTGEEPPEDTRVISTVSHLRSSCP